MDSIHDPVYVINLPRSKDRLRHAKKNLHAAGFQNINIFDATDGKNLRYTKMLQQGLACFDEWKMRELTACEIGCYLSHVRVWVDLLSKGYKAALICEDDVKLDAGSANEIISKISNLPDDWTILHIHSNFTGLPLEERKRNRRLLSEGIYHGWDEGGGTTCYALSSIGAMFLLQRAFPIKFAVDGLTNWLTHPDLSKVSPIEGLLNKGFVIDPSPCSTGTFTSSIDDIPGMTNKRSSQQSHLVFLVAMPLRSLVRAIRRSLFRRS